MWWKLFQFTVCLAVIASNIHWQWTDNGLLAGILGIAAASFLTAILTMLGDLLRRAGFRASGQGQSKGAAVLDGDVLPPAA